MGKASTSKRLRRESGWRRDRTKQPAPAPARPSHPAKFGVCKACGVSGLISVTNGSCVGQVAADFHGAVRVKSRAVACYARIQRQRERSQHGK